MAKIGAKYSCFAPFEGTEPSAALPEYGTGVILGKLNLTNITPNFISGEYYADDDRAEHLSELLDADGETEIDYLHPVTEALIFGSEYSDGEVRHNKYDDAPFGGYGFYQSIIVNKVRKYKAYYYPKTKFTPSIRNVETRSGSINLAGEKLVFKVFPPNVGDWEITREFETETAAKAWVESMLNIGLNHEINITISGEGTVSPVGTVFVADGESLVVNVEGSPDAAYDNGDDVLSSISAGKYTIATVAEPHNIVFIYTSGE